MNSRRAFTRGSAISLSARSASTTSAGNPNLLANVEWAAIEYLLELARLTVMPTTSRSAPVSAVSRSADCWALKLAIAAGAPPIIPARLGMKPIRSRSSVSAARDPAGAVSGVWTVKSDICTSVVRSRPSPRSGIQAGSAPAAFQFPAR